MLLLSYGATWVAQAYAGRPHHLAQMIKQAIAHKGFSYLHIISPCVTFDKTDLTYENLDVAVTDLPDDHDPHNRMEALRQASKGNQRILGLYYEQQRPTLSEQLNDLVRAARGDATSDARAGTGSGSL
jgi:2-oxoglutarate ferredoxin oxidoreductase subunit beta